MDEDPLDSLLGLEEEYYQEGYQLGVTDGSLAGYVEGKVFGVEKGFEKALEMGRMNGKAATWKFRLNTGNETNGVDKKNDSTAPDLENIIGGLFKLSDTGRLASQIDQLLSITSEKNVSISNDDDSVADFDDRLKRGAAKTKIISRIIGESDGPATKSGQKQGDGTGNIEDLSSLSARH